MANKGAEYDPRNMFRLRLVPPLRIHQRGAYPEEQTKRAQAFILQLMLRRRHLSTSFQSALLLVSVPVPAAPLKERREGTGAFPFSGK